jgi:hypothetical protein
MVLIWKTSTSKRDRDPAPNHVVPLDIPDLVPN